MGEQIEATSLTDRTREILIMYLSGKSYAEIGGKFDISRQRAEQIVKEFIPDKKAKSRAGRHSHLMSYPYYPHLCQEIEKKFGTVYALAQSAHMTATTIHGWIGKGHIPGIDAAQRVYTVLQTDKPFFWIFERKPKDRDEGE